MEMLVIAAGEPVRTRDTPESESINSCTPGETGSGFDPTTAPDASMRKTWFRVPEKVRRLASACCSGIGSEPPFLLRDYWLYQFP